MIVRTGTRQSALALKQVSIIRDIITRYYANIEINEVYFLTKGDRIKDVPLRAFGGKGVFVTEIEKALVAGQIDMAVHSAKDLPIKIHKDTELLVIAPRGDVRDVLVSRQDDKVTLLDSANSNKSFIIGTSSLRREMIMNKILPSCECKTLRGNVPTRLTKLRQKDYSGIILAAAGLERLNMHKEQDLYYEYLDPKVSVPSACQAIIAVQVLKNSEISNLLHTIQKDNILTFWEFTLERGIITCLEASCHEPVGVYSKILEDRIIVNIALDREGYTREKAFEILLPKDFIHLELDAVKHTCSEFAQNCCLSLKRSEN